MEQAYALAKEIQERSGIRIDKEAIEHAAKYKTRRKDEDPRRHPHHRERSLEKRHGAGDSHHRRHEHHQDEDLGYIDDPVEKIYAPKTILRELDKLNTMNKELQTKTFMDERQIRNLNDIIANLKDQLDDEAAGTMKLVADRENLKLQIEDYKRKFFAVLLLSGLSEKDVTHFFQKNPRANEITDEMINIKQEIKKYMDHDKQDKYELMNPVILSKRIHQLEEWNDQLNAASHDRINVLKDEIHLMKQDHHKVVEDLSNRVQDMAKKLNENNEVLHLMLTENLRLKDSRAEIEATFNKERKHLLEFLKSNDIDHTNLIDGPNKLIENAQMDALTIKKLQNLLSRTQNGLIRRENEIESYRAEFLKMEKKVARAMMEKEEYKKLYEENVRKMHEKNETLVKRGEKVDQRRKLEAAGFHNDVKDLARFLADLQQKLNYCLSGGIEKKMKENAAVFRRGLRRTSDENSKKSIIKTVRSKQKRTELNNDSDPENQRRSSKSTGIGSSIQSPQPPKFKTSLFKPVYSDKPRQDASGFIKLKLSKLSTPKGKSMKKDKPKPDWVDITAKDYTAKPKSRGQPELMEKRKSKDGKSNGKNPPGSTAPAKKKSSGIQCNELDIELENSQWLDEDIEDLIAMLNAPGAVERKPGSGSQRQRNPSRDGTRRSLPEKAARRSTGKSSQRTLSRYESDENNNKVEEIQKQLGHASKRLNEIERNARHLYHRTFTAHLNDSVAVLQ